MKEDKEGDMLIFGIRNLFCLRSETFRLSSLIWLIPGGLGPFFGHHIWDSKEKENI